MKYQTVIDELHLILKSVPGIQYTLKYEPKSIQATPMLYSLLDSVEVLQDRAFGQEPSFRYRIMHRMVFAWMENEETELQLAEYVNTVTKAVHDHSDLNGKLGGGIAFITDIDAGWSEINGITYRTLDFYSEVLEEALT